MRKLNDSGFTIVELSISTAVFAVVLLLCATAIIQVGGMFYKGTAINRTQDSARLVVDDVSQAIQYGTTGPVGSFFKNGAAGNHRSYCLGTVRYTYNTIASLGNNAGQSRHVLFKDRIPEGLPTCPVLDISQANPPGATDGQELLGTNMRIPVFGIFAPNPPLNTWRINVTVSFGETADLFVDNPGFTRCQSSLNGGNFCASSTINTMVVKRL